MRKDNTMAKKSKMDRGLDSLFFDNSIDVEETDSNAADDKNGSEGGISMVRISLIEPDKSSHVLSLTKRLSTSLPKISDSMAFCSLYSSDHLTTADIK